MLSGGLRGVVAHWLNRSSQTCESNPTQTDNPTSKQTESQNRIVPRLASIKVLDRPECNMVFKSAYDVVKVNSAASEARQNGTEKCVSGSMSQFMTGDAVFPREPMSSHIPNPFYAMSASNPV